MVLHEPVLNYVLKAKNAVTVNKGLPFVRQAFYSLYN